MRIPPFAQALFIVLVILGGAYLLFGGGPSLKTKRAAEIFSQDIANLPEAKPMEVVELKNGDVYNLTASIVKKKVGNQTVKMLAYNDSIPGPFIKIPQDAEVTINFTNNTDVETTIHSHGVRLENKFDGVPDVTQPPVSIGQSFIYKIKFPDPGIFWYHPHIREDYAQELGLYGNYFVTPTDTKYWSPVNREIPLFLDDILIEDGEIKPFSKEYADHALMGRFGNTMLVNGETDYKLSVKQGEVIRFYITNSANTRTFNFIIPDAKMKLIGSDGGKYEKETWADSVVLSPSERATVEVLFEKAGAYLLQHKTPDRTYTLGNISVSSEIAKPSYTNGFSVLKENREISASIDPFRSYFSKQPNKQVTLTVDMGSMSSMQNGNGGGHMMTQDGQMMSGGMMGNGEKIEWDEDSMNREMNEQSTDQMITWKIVDRETKKENEDIDWQFKVGDKVKISIFNDPKAMHPMQHPIHIHGQRFLVLSTNGVKNENLAWKDTVLIQNGDTVELLVDAANPGTWMMHCHISEHLESNMMMNFKVE